MYAPKLHDTRTYCSISIPLMIKAARSVTRMAAIPVGMQRARMFPPMMAKHGNEAISLTLADTATTMERWKPRWSNWKMGGCGCCCALIGTVSGKRRMRRQVSAAANEGSAAQFRQCTARNNRGLCSTKQHRPRNGANPSLITVSIAKRRAAISDYGQNCSSSQLSAKTA